MTYVIRTIRQWFRTLRLISGRQSLTLNQKFLVTMLIGHSRVPIEVVKVHFTILDVNDFDEHRAGNPRQKTIICCQGVPGMDFRQP